MIKFHNLLCIIYNAVCFKRIVDIHEQVLLRKKPSGHVCKERATMKWEIIRLAVHTVVINIMCTLTLGVFLSCKC